MALMAATPLLHHQLVLLACSDLQGTRYSEQRGAAAWKGLTQTSACKFAPGSVMPDSARDFLHLLLSCSKQVHYPVFIQHFCLDNTIVGQTGVTHLPPAIGVRRAVVGHTQAQATLLSLLVWPRLQGCCCQMWPSRGRA